MKEAASHPLIDLSQAVYAIKASIKAKDDKSLETMGVDDYSVSPRRTRVSLFSSGTRDDNLLEHLHADLHGSLSGDLRPTARANAVKIVNGRKHIGFPTKLQVRLNTDTLPGSYYYFPLKHNRGYVLDAQSSESPHDEYLVLREDKWGRKTAELSFLTDRNDGNREVLNLPKSDIGVKFYPSFSIST